MTDLRKALQESKEEYDKSAKEYFGNIEAPKVSGKSADDSLVYGRHLPGSEQQYRTAERLHKGFSKASRSGAFSKPSTGHAFFPSGMKFAGDFIDEMTPGKYKPKPKAFEEAKPLEQTAPNDTPKPAAILVELCMDCMQPIDYNDPKRDFVINLGCITQQDTQLLYAMGLRFGDFFTSMFHASCMEKVKEFRKYTTPLVMGGGMLSPKDQVLYARYAGEFKIHEGREINLGQWMAIKRLDRTATNTQNYIIEQRKKGNTSIFRDDRKEL